MKPFLPKPKPTPPQREVELVIRIHCTLVLDALSQHPHCGLSHRFNFQVFKVLRRKRDGTVVGHRVKGHYVRFRVWRVKKRKARR